MAKNPESFGKICLLCSEIFRILYIGRMPGICWGENPRDGVNTTTLRLRHSFNLIGRLHTLIKSYRFFYNLVAAYFFGSQKTGFRDLAITLLNINDLQFFHHYMQNEIFNRCTG